MNENKTISNKIFNNVSQLNSFDTILINDKIRANISDLFEKENFKIPISIISHILEKGVIKYDNYDRHTNTTMYILFNCIGNSSVQIDVYMNTKDAFIYCTSAKINYNLIKNPYDVLNFDKYIQITNIGDFLKNETDDEEIAKDCIKEVNGVYVLIFSYIDYLQKNKKVELRISKQLFGTKIKKKKHKKSIKKIFKNIINISGLQVITKKDSSVIAEKIKRPFNRKTDSWTVRGHYRLLKSGKRIFIKSYIKGKGRKIKPKEYQLN